MRRYYCRDENFFGDSAAATGLKSNLPFRESAVTPKELANFSPGFPTLGNKAERVKEPDGTLSELEFSAG